MKTHELKILPHYFDAVEKGIKTFEIRKNDRDFQVGDYLMLNEWEEGLSDSTGPEKVIVKERGYTGRKLTRKITYILYGNGRYGLRKGYVILGIKSLV